MIKIVLCLITTDFYKEEKYILSTRDDSIQMPVLDIDNYKDLTNNIVKILDTNIFQDTKMTQQYVHPKFVSINDTLISNLFEDTDKYLYFLYGCVCPKIILQSNYFWKTFDIYDTTTITELGIINNVIEYTI